MFDPQQGQSILHPGHIVFAGNQNHARLLATWNNEDTFVLGTKLEQFHTDAKTDPDLTLRSTKLYYCEDPKARRIVKRLKQQLKKLDKSIEDVYAEILTTIRQAFEEQAASRQDLGNIPNNLPVRLLLAVPYDWNLNACQMMCTAANRAKFPWVKLTHESEAATGSLWSRLPAHISITPRHFAEIIGLVSVDTGGGTHQVSNYHLTRPTTRQTATVALRLAKKPASYLCGSTFVNENFLKFFQKYSRDVSTPEKDVEGLARMLGITQDHLLDRLSDEFENLKTKFPHDTEYLITIRCKKKGKPKWLNITLSYEHMESFFEPIVTENILHIHEQRDESTRFVMLLGGFAKNDYYKQRVRDSFQSANIQLIDPAGIVGAGNYLPVSLGNLMRHNAIEKQYLPNEFSFYVAPNEQYDPQIHQGCRYLSRDSGEWLYKDHLVSKDWYMPDMDIAKARLISIPSIDVSAEVQMHSMDANHLQVDDFTRSQVKAWYPYHIPVSATSMQVTIYWSKSNDIKDHDHFIRQRPKRRLASIH